MKKLICLLLIAFFLPSIIGFSLQRSLTGKVVDDVTGVGIADVSVTEVGAKQGTTTDRNGLFVVRTIFSSTKIELAISMTGYTKQTIYVVDKIEGDIRLKRESRPAPAAVIQDYPTKLEKTSLSLVFF